MANSVLRININEAIPVHGEIIFTVGATTVTYQWVVSRTGIGEVTAAATITDTINNLITAIGLDYPALFTASYIGTGNQFDLTAVSSSDVFSNGQAPYLNVTFQYINVGRTIGAVNFLGNNYLINNEIIMQIATDVIVNQITVVFENLSNQNVSSEFILYPIGNTATLNISPILKSLFSYPSEGHDYSASTQYMPTLNTFKITLNYDGNTTPSVFTKSFIRGGNRTTKTNQTIADNTWLIPSDKIAVWAGYPIAGYYLETTAGTKVISKKLINTLPSSIIEYRRIKGCNQLYIKFLNQMGGYSYWLFDTFNETETNNNLGSYIRANEIEDLGNDANSKMQVTGKVPREYIELIKDLAVSPEIYMYKDSEWVRVISEKNPVMIDDNKRSYNVRINFVIDYRFNPSLLWSN